MKLAINGGNAIRTSFYRRWPIWNNKSYKHLTDVMHSNRWSIRGAWAGTEPKELVFSKAFAQYNKCSYCVLTTSGTTGLQIALEALNISYGDEVIVPALTWIAPITAILNAGAIPVMVDVERETTCISPESIKRAITKKTKAIMAIHLHCSIANMDEISAIAKEYDLRVIEDCSQAHGAMWGDNYVGSIGDIGVFSFNQEKVLTCGEGGAVVTNTPELYEKLFRTKTDGCNFDKSKITLDDDQLIYDNNFMGSNFCISEFQSAVLCGQLEVFEELNSVRRKNADYLDKKLCSIKGLTLLKHHPKAVSRTYYEYGVLLDLDYFARKDLNTVLNAISAEVNFPIHSTDVPVYRNILFSPLTKKKYEHYTNSQEFLELDSKKFPNCEYLHSHLAVFHHQFLLGDYSDMDSIISAFEKVQFHAEEI